MNKYLSIILIIFSTFIGSLGGYSLGVDFNERRLSTEIDIQIRTFAISYSALRNYTERSKQEADELMYKFMNTSIKKLYKLYPNASYESKESIYISYTAYTEYIQENSTFIQPNKEINNLVQSLIEKHNNAFKRDAEKAPRPLT